MGLHFPAKLRHEIKRGLTETTRTSIKYTTKTKNSTIESYNLVFADMVCKFSKKSSISFMTWTIGV